MWHEIYVTDKNGHIGFKGSCSPMALMGQIRETQRHIQFIKDRNKSYNACGFDPESVVLMVDGSVWGADENLDLDSLLNQLES